MKSKVFGKKLTLNKKTIADLNIDKMMNVHGGKDSSACTLPDTICSCANTCPNTCGDTCLSNCPPCYTECTCGTGVPLCPCASNDD